MRKLIYLVACTVDRYIAAEDGSLDAFLMQGDHITDLVETFPETIPVHLREAVGVRGPNRWFDVLLMGRRTYEPAPAIGVTNPYPHLKQYLVSRTLKQSPDPNIELVRGDPLALVRELKRQAGKDIWLCGGGELATTLFPEIDELILKMHPVLLGKGIPLFRGAVKQTRLELTSSKVYGTGVMLLRYRLPH